MATPVNIRNTKQFIDLVQDEVVYLSAARLAVSNPSNCLRAGAVGDICLRFLDGNRGEVNLPLDKQVVSIRLDQLAKAKRIVGVAGGQANSARCVVR